MATRIIFWMILLIFTHSVSTNIRSFTGSIFDGLKYVCVSNICDSLVNETTRDLRRCQISCFTHNSCNLVNFHEITKQCELMSHLAISSASPIADADSITMIVVSSSIYNSGEFDLLIHSEVA